MGVWPDPLRVRGASLGALVWLCLATAGLAQAVASDCTPELTVTDTDPTHIDLTVRFACHPYAPVDVLYGPFRIGEELSQDGALSLTLPRIDTGQDVAVEVGQQRVRVSVPNSAGTASGYVAVLWTDQPRWGELQMTSGEASQQLGFVGRTDHPGLDLLAVGPDAAGQAGLLVPVSPETCGQSLQATVWTAQASRSQPMSVSVPDCDLVGQSLWIPLS